jgi:hypothetical protein
MGEWRPVRKGGILARELGDEWILYDPEISAVHIVNEMAEFVWRMCDGQHSLEEMERMATAAYQIPDRTDVRAELESVIQSFADRGMLASQEA